MGCVSSKAVSGLTPCFGGEKSPTHFSPTPASRSAFTSSTGNGIPIDDAHGAGLLKTPEPDWCAHVLPKTREPTPEKTEFTSPSQSVQSALGPESAGREPAPEVTNVPSPGQAAQPTLELVSTRGTSTRALARTITIDTLDEMPPGLVTAGPAPTTTTPNSGRRAESAPGPEGHGISVAVRLRPVMTTQPSDREGPCVSAGFNNQVVVQASGRSIAFDYVLGTTSSQADTYNAVGPGLLDRVLSGYNVTCFAYGQTGTGKTYTMEGTSEQPGIMPRFCQDLFERIADGGSESGPVAITVSYVEIYQEKFRDLLAGPAAEPTGRLRRDRVGALRQWASSETLRGSPSARALNRSESCRLPPSTQLDAPSAPFFGQSPRPQTPGAPAGTPGPVIREHKAQGVYLEGAVERPVLNAAELLAVVAEGSRARAKADTGLNGSSSRSHAIFTLVVERRTAGNGHTLKSKVHLVDLAGSERPKATGCEGERLREGAVINKSLSALGNVISALGSKDRTHVPYRDSKLTRLLQDSLGGTAYTVVLCTISPASSCEAETLSTLRFAERLKRVHNRPTVQKHTTPQTLVELHTENVKLKNRIEELEAQLATAPISSVPPTLGALRVSAEAVVTNSTA